jgi:hypothetical protein
MTPSKRRLVAVAVLAMLMLALLGGPASGRGTICSNVADVSWVTDWDALTVDEVIVQVPGCSDGEQVGIQLITDGGDLPASGPRGAPVEAERAVFDITDLGVGVEPLTGVRVFLVIDSVNVPVVTVTVEQRFFNQAGNEQLGLRQTTVLNLAEGAQYRVPGAGNGYRDVVCSMVNSGIGADVRPQGAGSFPVGSAVRHVVCYQQVPGIPGGPGPGGPGISVPPGAELPEVLDSVPERGDGGEGGTSVLEGPLGIGTEVTGEARDAEGAAVRGVMLSRTGFEAITSALSGLLLVLLGAGLIRRFRTTS